LSHSLFAHLIVKFDLYQLVRLSQLAQLFHSHQKEDQSRAEIALIIFMAFGLILSSFNLGGWSVFAVYLLRLRPLCICTYYGGPCWKHIETTYEWLFFFSFPFCFVFIYLLLAIWNRRGSNSASKHMSILLSNAVEGIPGFESDLTGGMIGLI
jgi:hypothetical protein